MVYYYFNSSSIPWINNYPEIKGEKMAIKTSKDVLEEIKEARQHLESVTMILDGAQAHFIIESLAKGLEIIACTFVEVLQIPPSQWNDEYGNRSDTIEASRELGLTAISAIKVVVEALPDEIKLLKVELGPLAKIEKIFKEN
jgi:hypothetical protein